LSHVDGPGIDVSERVLQLVQDRHQRSAFALMPFGDGDGPLV